MEAFSDKDISNFVSQLYEKYEEPLGDEPLEELIDTDNIHGWLQNRIDIAETRHAALLSNFLSVYEEKAFCIVKGCYEKQGAEAGLDAKKTKNVSTPQGLYQAIYDSILDGMPCDQVNEIIENAEDHLRWEVKNCLHKKYWKEGDKNLDLFYQFRAAWITKFIENANPEFSYEFFQKEIDDTPTLIHRIYKNQ